MNITNELKTYFESRYRPRTVESYLKEWTAYQVHASGVEQADHRTILSYIEHLQSKGWSARSINRSLSVLQQSYGHLYPTRSNPVQGLRLKRATPPSIPRPLRAEALRKALDTWPRTTAQEKRDYLMLSFIHHQALNSGELKALQLTAIDLDQAILHVASHQRSISRELSLQATQIAPLSDYIHRIGPKLGGRRYERGYLFSTGGQSLNLQNQLQKLSQAAQSALLSEGHVLHNLEHWRSSRIVHLLERYPLLEVQQLIGHRYASSTERYEVHVVEQLGETLSRYHPLA